MSIDCVNFGYEFNASIDSQSAIHMKELCKGLLIVLVSEIQKRIPENIEILD